jgi:hypothetical protein
MYAKVPGKFFISHFLLPPRPHSHALPTGRIRAKRT